MSGECTCSRANDAIEYHGHREKCPEYERELEELDGSPGNGCCDSPRIVTSRWTGEAHCGNCGTF